MKKLRGGIEGVVAAIVIAGIIVALLLTVVVPMSEQGDDLLNKSTNNLTQHQLNMKPSSAT